MKKGLIVILSIIITIVVVVPLIYFKFLEPAGIAKEVGMILMLVGFVGTTIFMLKSNYKKSER